MDYRRSASRRVKWIVLAALFGTLAFAQMASAAISVFGGALTNVLLVNEQFTYQVSVSNFGPTPVDGVQVVDTLPAGVTFVSVTTTQGTCGEAAGVVTCDVGTVAPVFGQTIEIVVVAPDAPGRITNSVTWTPDAPASPLLMQNDVLLTHGPTDLEVGIGGPDAAAVGVVSRIQVNAINLGPDIAQNVVLTVDLPEGVARPFGSPCSADPTTTHEVCSLGNIPPGLGPAVFFTFLPTDTTPAPNGVLTITASVASDLGELAPADNTATKVMSFGGLSVDDVTLVEGDAGVKDAVFTLTKHGAGAGTVAFATEDGTASQNADYTPVSGSVTFTETDTTKTVAVPVLGDVAPESDEFFSLVLSNPVGLNLVDDTGLGQITDDDPPPSLSIDDVSVAEGNDGTTLATFTINLSGPSGQGVFVDYGTTDGTASSASDYTGTAGFVEFLPGQTSATFAVPVQGDTEIEPDETFAVHLSGAFNATIADGDAVGTIVNDDVITPPVKQPLVLTKSADQATSFTGTLNGYTITITNPNAEAVTVTRLVDCLPARFTYRTSSTTGAVTTSPVRGRCGPGRASQSLTWNTPVVVSAGGSVSLHFGVRVGSHRGVFMNAVTGVATGYDVTGTGPTAAIRVVSR